MTIPQLNLDDRTFDDLVEELQALIPRYAPDWTDRNTSDPGIMLMELFAWLSESQIYRINRIPKDVYRTLYQWIIGPQWQAATTDPAAQLDEARRQAYSILSRQRHRLISTEDFQAGIIDRFGIQAGGLSYTPFPPAGAANSYPAPVYSCVARVYCASERDFSAHHPQLERPGHFSIVIVPQPVSRPLVKASARSAEQKYAHRVNALGQRIVMFAGNHVSTWAGSYGDDIESFDLPDGTKVTDCVISPDDGAVAVVCEEAGASYVYVWRARESDGFVRVETHAADLGKTIDAISLAGADGPMSIQLGDEVRLSWFVPGQVGGWAALDMTYYGKPYFQVGGHRMALDTPAGIQVWQLEHYWVAPTYDIEIRGSTVAVSDPLHQYAAMLNEVGELALWDIWRGEKRWARRLSGGTPTVKFDGDRKTLSLTTGDDEPETTGSVKSLHLAVENGEPVSVRASSPGGAWIMSDDGRRGATLDNDETRVTVWDIERDEELAIFEHAVEVSSQLKFREAFFTSDNHYLVTISSSETDLDHREIAVWKIGFDEVKTFVAERAQIGSWYHIVGPRYARFFIRAQVVAIAGSNEQEIERRVLDQLSDFFDPRHGGPNGEGWPFNRDVTPSEVYRVIHTVPGVAYIPTLNLCDYGDGSPAKKSIIVEQNELARFDYGRSGIHITFEPRV